MKFIQRLIVAAVILAFTTSLGRAVEDDAAAHPNAPFEARFAYIQHVDIDKGIVVCSEIFAERVPKTVIIRELFETPNGKLAVRNIAETSLEYQQRLTTHVLAIDETVVSNSAGKQMTLREAMERVDLNGRRVLLVASPIDPFYLPFLAKETLIVTTKSNLADKASPIRVTNPAISTKTPTPAPLAW